MTPHSRAELFEHYAEINRAQAETMTDPWAKRQSLEAAEYWQHLAMLQRALHQSRMQIAAARDIINDKTLSAAHGQ